MSSKDGEYQTIQNLSSDSVDILQKISLVKKIALYLKARVPDYMEVDDMVQIGMVGLIEASKLYDASVGVTFDEYANCLLYTSPSPRDRQKSRMPSSA